MEELTQISNKSKVPQGSVLSLFLFNVYMHELDIFIRSLEKKLLVSISSYKVKNREATKKYVKFMKLFSKQQLASTLKQYDLPNATQNTLKKLNSPHYIKTGRSRRIDRITRIIQYVRYANDFLISIVSPKFLIWEIRAQINQFIKGNLHLKVKKDKLVIKGSKPIKFLGFLIYPAAFNEKIRSENGAKECIV